MKKLYRSQTNKIFFGIFGGLGEYMEIDPTVLRLVYTLISLITGFFPGIVFYLLALFIIPQKQDFNFHKVSDEEVKNNKKNNTEIHSHKEEKKSEKEDENTDTPSTENKLAKN